MGLLKAIARRNKLRAPMQLLEAADVTGATGVANDFRGKSQTRTVTVLSEDVWSQVCEQLGGNIPWTTRRANFLVQGIGLPKVSGGIIQVGVVHLQVTGEVDPCSRMEEQCPGLKDLLSPDWRGGVACFVVKEGTVAIGDAVSIHSS